MTTPAVAVALFFTPPSRCRSTRELPAGARHTADDTPASTKAREAIPRTPRHRRSRRRRRRRRRRRPPRSPSSCPTPPPPCPCRTTRPRRSRRPILPIPRMARAWHRRPCPTSSGGIVSGIDFTAVRG